MFDLRYHVASLAAVFVALVIGILVGVAMSGKVDDAEKQALKSDVNRLEAQLNAASEGRAKVSREHTALRAFIKNAYPMLIADRLHGKRVALLFVGPVDAGVRQQIEQAVSDAGGAAPMRLRALKVPIDPTNLDGHLDGDLAQYKTAGLDDLGREFAHELVHGGDTPAWDALTSQLVEEKAGSFRRPVDGVIVARTVKPQSGPTATFLSGLYAGLGDAAVPAVGVEPSGVSRSAVPRGARTGCRPWTTSKRRRDDLHSRCSSPAARPGTTASRPAPTTGSSRRSRRKRVADPSAVLVAARDEEDTIAQAVAALREQFPRAEVIVADDGSRDATAEEAERAGARVLQAAQARKGTGPHPRRAGRTARLARAGRRRPRRRSRPARRRRRRPDRGRVRRAPWRRLRNRKGPGARADPHAFRLRGPRAAVRAAAPRAPRRANEPFRSRPASVARCA